MINKIKDLLWKCGPYSFAVAALVFFILCLVGKMMDWPWFN